MADLTELLTRVGLTWGQAIGFAVTIMTAGLAARAARASSRESKRQHDESRRLERLAAAADLIVSLNKFERHLEELLYDNINCSQMFGHHTTLKGAKLRDDAHQLAAKLGDNILTMVIDLEAKLADAESAVVSIGTILGDDEAEDEVTKHSASLILASVELINSINIEVGTKSFAKASMEEQRLMQYAKGADDDD